MAMVSPSLLAADFACLGTECRKVLDAGAQWLHFDVMDGCFVPNISFGVPVLAGLRKALPDAFFDVHLMIRDPLAYIEPFAKAGASLITFHLESDSDVGATLAAIKAAGCKAGISIKPATPVSALEPWLDQLDLVLGMCVEPGFGCQSFMPGALDKLSALAQEKRRRGLPFLLEVDGGVDEASGTAAACVNAGAEVLVAGSAVFRAADPAAAVAGLLRL